MRTIYLLCVLVVLLAGFEVARSVHVKGKLQIAGINDNYYAILISAINIKFTFGRFCSSDFLLCLRQE
jgi:hypothetical protein